MTTTPATQAGLFPRIVTHEQARQAAKNFIDAHFNNPGGKGVLTGIPARDDHDDIVLTDYIRQQAASHSLPGDVGKAEWLNLMPREIVARAALNEGCQEKTANDIRSGLHGDVKIRAEVAVKLVGFIQEQCFAALTPSALSGDAGEGE